MRPAALLCAAGLAACVPRGPAPPSFAELDRAIHRGRTGEAERVLAAASPRGPRERAELARLEGELRLAQGRPADAARAFARSEADAAAVLGASSPEARGARLDRAHALALAGDLKEAERLARSEPSARRGELAERLGELALAAQEAGRDEEAERLCRGAAEESRRTFGEEDPRTAARLSDWGLQLQRMGRLDEAERAYRRSSGALERALAPGHPRRDAGLVALGLFLESRGRDAEAEALYRRALEEAGAAGRRSEAARHLASLLRRLGRPAEAP